MGRGNFTKAEMETLLRNPYVADVNEKSISYSTEFKFLFMNEYIKGKRPTEIFRDAGFDIGILGSKRIERACARWKESYQSGTLGERSAVLGKASSSSEADASLSEKMKSGKKYTIDRCRQQEEIIKKLRAEVLLLRQLCEKKLCVQKSARSSNRSRSRRNTTAVFLISAKPPASAATPSTNTAETKRHAGCEFVT